MLKTALIPLALLLALAAFARAPLAGGEACRRAELDARVAAEGRRELFFAVLEGLYADGVSNAAADAVLALDPESGLPASFVKGCPICMPAFEAFRAYRARPEWVAFKGPLGEGLDEATERALVRGGAAERFEASGELVQGWIARRLEARRLTPEERAAWGRVMEDWRKKGMSILGDLRASDAPGVFAARKGCQMCDAANAACKG